MRPGGSFKGKSHHSINDAGRVSIPSKFREVLRVRYNDETLVLVPYGTHLAAYPAAEWEKIEDQMEANPPTDAEAKKFMRFLYSNAEEVGIDKQGRILIPTQLRELTPKLTDECVIVGFRTKMEIWPKSTWESDYSGFDIAEMADRISDEHPGLNL